MNLLLKKSVVEKYGGFDESLPAQYDTDFGFRLTRGGYKLAYEPRAKCYHFNRSTVSTYFRQQLQYGKNTIKLYFKHSSLIKGDEITDFWMNIQPALLLSSLIFFALGILNQLRMLWYASLLVIALILIYHIFSAARISTKYDDLSAMRLVILYFVRAAAWLIGATVTATKRLLGDRS
jgi:succinoglycan biosynthesis protein ExoA